MLTVSAVLLVGQRLVVAISCAVFFIAIRVALDQRSASIILGAVSLLACIEKLCSNLNMVSVEKDWVCYVFQVRLGKDNFLQTC